MHMVHENAGGTKTIKFSAREFFHLAKIVTTSDYKYLGEEETKFWNIIDKNLRNFAGNGKPGSQELS